MSSATWRKTAPRSVQAGDRVKVEGYADHYFGTVDTIRGTLPVAVRVKLDQGGTIYCGLGALRRLVTEPANG